MENIKAALLAVLVFVNVVFSHNHHEWRKHNARVREFTCATPQPRSMDIKDLFDEETLRSVINILPASTVLHRCGSSGCCPANKTCVPVETEEVKLVFLVREAPKSTKYLEVSAQNHTNCACQHHSNNPK